MLVLRLSWVAFFALALGGDRFRAACVVNDAPNVRPPHSDTPKAGGVWVRHTIDASSKGADGVRLGDLDGDGLLDIATGWEQGGVTRVCINPGPRDAKSLWPGVTVGEGPSPEDAVMADLDGDGILDVISCHEGGFKRVLIHFFRRPATTSASAEQAVTRKQLLDPENWSTVDIAEARGRTRWMYALPMQVDQKHGIDLIVGSKDPNGVVGWLQAPGNPRKGSAWKFHLIESAGWIMTLDALSASGPAIVVTDRKGQSRAAYRLDLVDRSEPERASSWKRTNLGGVDHEVMFAALVPPDNDVLLAASRDGVWFAMPTQGASNKSALVFPNPLGIRSGKSIAVTPYGDDEVLLAHTTNTGNDGKAHQIPGVAWAIAPRKTLTDDGQDSSGKATLQWHAMSDDRGVKFDRGEWLDLDDDGDKDFITCEEVDNLGVFWYENPGI